MNTYHAKPHNKWVDDTRITRDTDGLSMQKWYFLGYLFFFFVLLTIIKNNFKLSIHKIASLVNEEQMDLKPNDSQCQTRL